MVSGRYDPSHRDADWSGFVAFTSKKHVETPPSQLKTNDTGIAPDEGENFQSSVNLLLDSLVTDHSYSSFRCQDI